MQGLCVCDFIVTMVFTNYTVTPWTVARQVPRPMGIL